MTINFNGTTGVTFPDSSVQNTAASGFGFKNRLINGAMMIDQRNAGASVTATGNPYTIDRWQAVSTQAAKFTVQRNAGSVTPPTGFINYLGITSSSSYSVLSTDAFAFSQCIEGLNCADLAWGSANAQTVTLSFWARSSLTGTFGGSIYNSAANRSYVFSYTIASANTWTSISVIIPGDTTGTWLTTNGIGMGVRFGLGSGSTYSGTANAWQAGNIVQPTGTVSVVGTSGATFYITGVQLEKGSTATTFDYRPYGTELALCQRYLPVWSASNGRIGLGMAYSGTNAIAPLPIITTPRVAPTGITVSGTSYLLNSSAGGVTVNSITFNIGTTSVLEVIGVVTSGLTAGNATVLGTTGTLLILGTGCEL